MWTMGWYRFHVDIDSGDVRMDDRGYEELTDLQPNAAVRADGTVQLAPAQISRAAAAQRQPERQPEPAAPAQDSAPAEPETPRVAAQKPPEILEQVAARAAQRRRGRVVGADAGAGLRLGPLRR